MPEGKCLYFKQNKFLIAFFYPHAIKKPTNKKKFRYRNVTRILHPTSAKQKKICANVRKHCRTVKS